MWWWCVVIGLVYASARVVGMTVVPCGAVNCTSHQQCVGNACQCLPVWAGAYCEWPLQALSSGVAVNGTLVNVYDQAFFALTLSTAVSLLTVELTPTAGTSAAVELFLSQGAQPTPFSFQFANSSAVPGAQTISLAFPNTGVWVALVLGLASNSSFSIVATASIVCPNGCSGHGACGQTTSGVCACAAGWSLADCSLPMVTLSNATASNATAVAAGAWSFFQLQVGATTQVSVALAVVDATAASATGVDGVAGRCASSACAASLPTTTPTTTMTTASPTAVPPVPAPVVAIAFVRAGQLPSQLQYDASAALSTATTIEIDTPTSGVVYYVGVLATAAATTVTVTASYGQLCANGCSGHGACVSVAPGNATCACDEDWGVNAWDCSVYEAPLRQNETFDGAVRAGEWRYYSLFVPLDKNHVTFSCNLTSPSNGTTFSLFINANARPTLYAYTQRAPPNSTHAQVTLSGTAVAGQWYVGVYGEARGGAATARGGAVTASAPQWRAGDEDDDGAQYQLRLSMASLCPQRCSDHGACVQNHCNCLAGYVGDDCSSERLMLTAGVPFRGSVSFNTWNYYTITVQENALEIQVNETYNNFVVGLVWVYARRVQASCAGAAQGHCLPTSNTFDVANTSATGVHAIYIPSQLANGTWNVGVTGSAAESARVDAEYVIAAYVGCERYASCELCAQDPNCGWCARDALHGSCVAGDPQGTDKSGSCVGWFFAHCENTSSQKDSTLTGTVIGISVGFCVVFGISVAFVVFWWKQQQRKNRSPLGAFQAGDSPQRVRLPAQPQSQPQPQSARASASRDASDDGGSGILARVGRSDHLRRAQAQQHQQQQDDEVVEFGFGRKPAFEQ
jgi:hypothetical protein